MPTGSAAPPAAEKGRTTGRQRRERIEETGSGEERTMPGKDTSLFNEVMRKRLQQTVFTIKNLREREKTYRLIVENTPDAVVETDEKGRVRYANPSSESIFGYRQVQLVGSPLSRLIARESAQVLRNSLRAHLAASVHDGIRNPTRVSAVAGCRDDGRKVTLDILITSFRRRAKDTVILVMRDVTDRTSMADQLQASRDSYWALSETTTDAILQIAEDFRIIFANTAVEQIFGYRSCELLHKSFAALFPSPVYDRYLDTFRKYFFIDESHRQATNLRNTVEILGAKKGGEIVPLDISFGNSKSVRGQRTLTCIVRDITERKRVERKLRFLAYHDRLTSLGNRDLFGVSLHDFLASAARSKSSCGALLFLDLDGFKKVNDTLGHEVGDRILVECSRRLRDSLRESDQVYRMGDELVAPDDTSLEDLFRFGGDEFVILLTNLRKSTDAAIVAQKIIDSIRRPYDVSGCGSVAKISLGVSIGVALIPQDGLDAKSLISSADVAMYRAKELGNRFAFFSPEMNQQATASLVMENQIRSALEEDRVRVHYQPIADAGGRIHGVEALARLVRPEGGLISPDAFIPVAEESGLIVPLGHLVFEMACRDLLAWNRAGRPDLCLSVNVSARQLQQEDFVERIAAAIQRHRLSAANLTIELTESAIMTDPEATVARMQALRGLTPGIRFAIDDFGTGYSSLSYLSNLPIDTLKIDRSFVAAFTDGRQSRIIDAIITLADGLRLEAIPEGVETKEQLAYLVARKCRLFQGYYFSKPVPPEDIAKLLARR